MSDTPETDAVLDQGYYNDDLVIACRRLERERDEARGLAENWRDAFDPGRTARPPRPLTTFPWEEQG